MEDRLNDLANGVIIILMGESNFIFLGETMVPPAKPGRRNFWMSAAARHSRPAAGNPRPGTRMSRGQFLRTTGMMGGAVAAAGLGLSGAVKATGGNILNVPSQYPTIQEALSFAQPGDTIKVAAGTHTGAVVCKSDITIEGSGQGSTFISGFATPLGTMGFAALPGFVCPTSKINNVKIRNLSFESVVRPIYSLGDCDGWEISYVAINNAYQGITNFSGSGWKITDNTILNSVFGVVLIGAPPRGPFLKDNRVSTNNITLSVPGSGAITCANYNTPESEGNNVIVNNTVSGSGSLGLDLFNTTTATVSGNNLSGLTTEFAQASISGTGGSFTANNYGPSHFAGLYCTGGSNSFTNENFLGNYPGWNPSFNGCIYLEVGSENNMVAALKNGLVMHGYDICNQVFDANLYAGTYSTTNAGPGYEKCSRHDPAFVGAMQAKSAALSDKVEQNRQKVD